MALGVLSRIFGSQLSGITQVATYKILGDQTTVLMKGVHSPESFVPQTVSLRPLSHNLKVSTAKVVTCVRIIKGGYGK